MGYDCNLLTDTEVITYIIDYLVRKQGLTWQEAAEVMAAPFWSTIDQLPEPEKKRMTLPAQSLFSSLLITGPFSILVGFEGGMMALNDRLKLRSMVVAEKGDIAYMWPARSAPSAWWSRMLDQRMGPPGRRTGDLYRVKEGKAIMAIDFFYPAL